MRTLLILLAHLLSRAVTLWGTGGARAVLAENLMLKHQLLVIRRFRRRAPHLHPADRVLLGFLSRLLEPRRLVRIAVILKPATLLRFHRGLRDLKYLYLYGRQTPAKRRIGQSRLQVFGAPSVAGLDMGGASRKAVPSVSLLWGMSLSMSFSASSTIYSNRSTAITQEHEIEAKGLVFLGV